LPIQIIRFYPDNYQAADFVPRPGRLSLGQVTHFVHGFLLPAI
jgi:hypothetical protein